MLKRFICNDGIKKKSMDFDVDISVSHALDDVLLKFDLMKVIISYWFLYYFNVY